MRNAFNKSVSMHAQPALRIIVGRGLPSPTPPQPIVHDSMLLQSCGYGFDFSESPQTTS